MIVQRHALTQEEITMLLRGCIVAPDGKLIVAADFASIEARFTAWAADDTEAIKVFLDPTKDVYCVAASRIVGREVPKKRPDGSKDPMRQAGKIAELACGFGGGEGALRRMAPGMGIDLDALGIEPKSIVSGWRELHAPIVQLWRDLEHAAVEAIADRRETQAGPFGFSYVEKDLAMILPSGRPIVYRRAQLTPGRFGPQIRFLSAQGPEHTYGGKLTENGVQAGARDLMTDAMVRVDAWEDPRLDLILTVHDEIVAEVDEHRADEGLAAVETCMKTLKPEYEGLPIGCEGFVCKRYGKYE